MMLHCTGQGLPTGMHAYTNQCSCYLNGICDGAVVLDAPIGQSSDVWALVRSVVAKRTRVCVYDRAGIGFSDRAITVS